MAIKAQEPFLYEPLQLLVKMNFILHSYSERSVHNRKGSLHWVSAVSVTSVTFQL